MLYIINLSYATFGIVVDNDTVIRAAPIGSWMVGKNITFISRWVSKKGGTIKKYFPKGGISHEKV